MDKSEKTVTIRMTSLDQYYKPLITGSTIVYKGELYTIRHIHKNSQPTDYLKIRIAPLLVIDDLIEKD